MIIYISEPGAEGEGERPTQLVYRRAKAMGQKYSKSYIKKL